MGDPPRNFPILNCRKFLLFSEEIQFRPPQGSATSPAISRSRDQWNEKLSWQI
jgi:hypothetical protein